jgi:hypothetical protein
MIKKYSKRKTKIHRNIKGGGRKSVNRNTNLPTPEIPTNKINNENTPGDILSLFDPPFVNWRSGAPVDQLTLDNIEFIESSITTMTGFSSNINIHDYIETLFKSYSFFQKLVKINYDAGLKKEIQYLLLIPPILKLF